MKKDNKSDYTINFTRKALTYLGKLTSLKEPEAVKMLLADLKTSDFSQKKVFHCELCDRWFCEKHLQPRLIFIRGLEEEYIPPNPNKNFKKNGQTVRTVTQIFSTRAPIAFTNTTLRWSVFITLASRQAPLVNTDAFKSMQAPKELTEPIRPYKKQWT